jgi:nitrite reductase (NADH) large subunit
MRHVIETYQCEWKTTVDSSEKVKQFAHFVNSDAGDDNVLFVGEREQIRPATGEEKQVETSENVIAIA